MANMYRTSLHQTQAGTNPSLAQKTTWIICSFSSYGVSYDNKEVKEWHQWWELIDRKHLWAWQQFKLSSVLIGTERRSQQQHASKNYSTCPSRELRVLWEHENIGNCRREQELITEKEEYSMTKEWWNLLMLKNYLVI